MAFSIVNCKRSTYRLGLPLTKEECAKDETKQWNEDKGVCEDKQAEVMTKEECEKDETKQWNAEANEGKGACEDKPEEKVYTITNKIDDVSVVQNQLSIRMETDVLGKGVDLDLNGCLKIKESQFAKMRVYIIVRTGQDVADSGKDDIILCDSLDAEQSDCKVGNYEAVASLPVHYGPAQPRLIPSSKNESEDCKDPLNLEEK